MIIIVGVLWAYVWIKAEQESDQKKTHTHNEWDLLSKRKHKNGLKYTLTLSTEAENAQFYDEFNVEKISILLNEHH